MTDNDDRNYIDIIADRLRDRMMVNNHYPTDEERDNDEQGSVGSSSLPGIEDYPPLLVGRDEDIPHLVPRGILDDAAALDHPRRLGRVHLLPPNVGFAREDDGGDDDDSVGSESSSSTGSIPPLIPRGWFDDSGSDDDSDIDMPHLVNLRDYHNNVAGNPFQFLAANPHRNGGNGIFGGNVRNNNNNQGGPDLAAFNEFLSILRNSECTEMYRYYVSRQERLVSLMLRLPDKADEFVAAAEGNKRLQHLHLDISFRYTEAEMEAEGWMGEEEYYSRWQKIGLGVGKFQGLEELQIHAGGYLTNQNAPDLRALSHVINGGATTIKKFVMTCDLLNGDNVDFANGFRDHATLEKIEFRGYFEAEPMHAIAQELTTIPNLSRVDVLNCFSRSIPSRVLPNFFLRILEKPSICHLTLQRCTLSEEQCGILANSVQQNSNLELLNFQYSRFEGQGGRMVAESLTHSAKLQKLVYSTKSMDRDICAALAQTLAVNTSIEHLQIEAEEDEWASDVPAFDASWFDPLFESLQSNATVNFMQIGELDHWNDATADKFRAILESPTTAIAELWLKSQGDAFLPWQRIVPALGENRVLKSLKLLAAVGHAGVVATAAVLETNTALKNFEAYPCSRLVCGRCEHPFAGGSIYGAPKDKTKVCREDCVSARAVEALGHNRTLKRLMVDTCIAHHTKDVSEEGCMQLVAALKDNFGLEDDDISWGRQRDFKKIMETMSRLNKAGRRYLLDNPADRISGVQVLSEVSDSIDCLFTHLQENPNICIFQC